MPAPSFVVWLSWQALLYFPLIETTLIWNESLLYEWKRQQGLRRQQTIEGELVFVYFSCIIHCCVPTCCHLSLFSYFCMYCRRNHGRHSVRWRKRREEADKSGKKGEVRTHPNPVPNPNPYHYYASQYTSFRKDDDLAPQVGVQHTIHTNLEPPPGVQHTTDNSASSQET
jgi:hypothetical protein